MFTDTTLTKKKVTDVVKLGEKTGTGKADLIMNAALLSVKNTLNHSHFRLHTTPIQTIDR